MAVTSRAAQVKQTLPIRGRADNQAMQQQLAQQKKAIVERKAQLKSVQKQQQGKKMLPEQVEALKQEKQTIKSMKAAQAKGAIAPGLIPKPGALRAINAAKGTLVKKPTVKKLAIKKITAKKK